MGAHAIFTDERDKWQGEAWLGLAWLGLARLGPNKWNDLQHRQGSVIPRYAQRGREEDIKATDWLNAVCTSGWVIVAALWGYSVGVKATALLFFFLLYLQSNVPIQSTFITSQVEPHLQNLSKYLAMWFFFCLRLAWILQLVLFPTTQSAQNAAKSVLLLILS